MPERTVNSLFLSFSRMKLLEQYWPRMRRCVESLTDEQVWWRPNDESNSVGNLMLHLNGNVTQWMIASFNRLEDTRDRPAEFAANEETTRAELIAKLGATVAEAGKVLDRLTEAELTATYEIQGFRVSGLQAVYQVVEHFGLHYGQVLYITKMLTARDMQFTKGQLDASGRAIQRKTNP
jgi:uncharacterized damage-inducible protein DinB